MKKYPAIYLIMGSTLFSFSVSLSAQAQIVPDNTLPDNTEVTLQDDVIQIDGGTIRDSNLFHSFQEFSVSRGSKAVFNNADAISNILSRVTGNKISEIDGEISANGTANLFLINPAGIVFGKGAFLDVGGSFIATTADSLLFPNGIEYSATVTRTPPLLTINAPIGLGFRDDPGAITNRNLNVLQVEDKTLALIGGEVSIDGGFLSTLGGRIEIGSVAENNTVSLTEVEEGWDIGYEGVENFQDISFTFGAFVENSGDNTGDVQVQGRHISLTEGSQIGINTLEGKVGNLDIVASESLTLDGNLLEVDLKNFKSLIFSNVFHDATGEGSKLTINTQHLSITNGGQLNALTSGTGKGVDIEITASEIELDGAFNNSRDFSSGIFTQVEPGEDITGEGGELTINADKLTVSNGAAVSTATFSSGNAGDLLVNADESVKLMGTIPGTNIPSFLNSFTGGLATAKGNAGDLTVNTPRLELRDGAQIGTVARNTGNGGDLTLNISDSILLTGASPLAGLRRPGRSGIFVSAQPSFTDPESGAIIPTTGDGGILNLTTEELTIEQGANISINTFSEGNGGNGNINVNKLIVRDGGEIGAGSLLETDNIDTERGNGGNLKIDATESVEVTGIGDINGEPVYSIFTLAQSNGDAGNITLTTNKLNVSNDGNINASAFGRGAAGIIKIQANEINLDRGTISASTNFGNGGNINLLITEDLTLRNNSLISAQAFNEANGGNLSIDARFIVAFPNQNEGNGNDIITRAPAGRGGDITIDAQGVFGIEERSANDGNETNDIDASGTVDGNVEINILKPDAIEGAIQLPSNPVEPEQTVAQACRSDRLAGKSSSLKIKGKGGIAASPNQLPDSDSTQAGWVAPAPIKKTEAELEIDSNVEDASETVDIDSIIPAQGVIVDEQGRVILVGHVPTDNEIQRSRQNLFTCLKQHDELDK